MAWRVQTLDGLLKLGEDISLDAEHLVQHAKLPKLGLLLLKRGHYLVLHQLLLWHYRTCSDGVLGQKRGQELRQFCLAGFLVIESYV